jgi:D-alanine-D-alanine ligase
MAKIGLVFGGRSVEHRVSVTSARTVAAGLEETGHTVVPLGIAEDGCWVTNEESLAALDGAVDALVGRGQPVAATLRRLLDAEPEVVFPLVHGTWGEDGTLQGLCEMLDLPYVGAGVTASAVAMDKGLSKGVFEAAGVPVVEYEVISRAGFETDREGYLERAGRLPLPVFVKPCNGGSSVGVRRVHELASLGSAVDFAFKFDESVLVERGIEGRELECSVLGDLELEASAVGEIVPGNEFYDYADKYLQDTAGLVAPAELPDELADRVRELAVRSFAVIGGAGRARVDFLLEGEEELFVNEINPLPGFTSISMYPRLWEISGLSLSELVDRLVEIAIARHRRRRQLDSSIKEWLATLEG